jgi:uncharacterized protein
MTDAAADVVRRMFDAVQRRDLATLLECYDPDVEIHEAGCLPYGGVHRGHDGAREHAFAWFRAWGAHQPGEQARLDPSFLSGADGTVVVLFTHRAVDQHCGRRLAEPEVSVYRVREGRVVRSQMFHADSAAVAGFLEHVRCAHPELAAAEVDR